MKNKKNYINCILSKTKEHPAQECKYHSDTRWVAEFGCRFCNLRNEVLSDGHIGCTRFVPKEPVKKKRLKHSTGKACL